MLALDFLAERRIAEAIAHGAFADLPGQGQPLDLDDDAMIPEALRMVYRILKNAGYVPPELESLRELRELERLVDNSPDGERKRQALLRLDLLRTRMEAYGLHRSTAGFGPRTPQRRSGSRISTGDCPYFRWHHVAPMR